MGNWSGAEMRCAKCNKYLPDRCTCNGPSIEQRRIQEQNVEEQERNKLLAEREKLVEEIKALKVAPITGRSQAAQQFRIEDLNALAKKVTSIDKKLGRI